MADDADARTTDELNEEGMPAGEPTPSAEVEETAQEDAAQETGETADEVSADALAIEIADLKDQLLRKTADFDNFRKRMIREKEELGAYANRELLLDVVPIIDDFERAIQSSEDSQDFAAFHDGILGIEKNLVAMLERKWKLVRFESAGEEFDPHRHEAMMTEESSEVEQPTVMEDYQKGYMLGEKVIRAAKVRVAMPQTPGESE